MNRETLIDNHYNNYDEENRLIKDNTHNVEYQVTKTYIQNFKCNKCQKQDSVLISLNVI